MVLEASLTYVNMHFPYSQYPHFRYRHHSDDKSGGVISNVITKPRIRGVCRSLLTVPFFFAFTSQVIIISILIFITLATHRKDENPVDVDLYLAVPALPGGPLDTRSTPTLEGD